VKKEYLQIAVVALVAVAVANTIVKRVPVAGPIVGRVLSGL